MDPASAGLIGAGIGVAGTLGVEGLRQLAADRSKRAERVMLSTGYHRENFLGLQDSLLDMARLTTRIMERRKAGATPNIPWANILPDAGLLDQWRAARGQTLKYQVRIGNDALREAVERCGNLSMSAIFGLDETIAQRAHREADEIMMGDINPRIGELLRATY